MEQPQQAESRRSGLKNFVRSVRPLLDLLAEEAGDGGDLAVVGHKETNASNGLIHEKVEFFALELPLQRGFGRIRFRAWL
jgi:hypothetical protein